MPCGGRAPTLSLSTGGIQQTITFCWILPSTYSICLVLDPPRLSVSSIIIRVQQPPVETALNQILLPGVFVFFLSLQVCSLVMVSLDFMFVCFSFVLSWSPCLPICSPLQLSWAVVIQTSFPPPQYPYLDLHISIIGQLMHSCTHTHMHTCTDAHMSICKHTHTWAHTYTHTHTQAHMYTCTHASTHTHTAYKLDINLHNSP